MYSSLLYYIYTYIYIYIYILINATLCVIFYVYCVTISKYKEVFRRDLNNRFPARYAL